jgi:hypothetical protein
LFRLSYRVQHEMRDSCVDVLLHRLSDFSRSTQQVTVAWFNFPGVFSVASDQTLLGLLFCRSFGLAHPDPKETRPFDPAGISPR